MMIVCISWDAQHEHQAKHKSRGLPFVVHGCLQLLWGQAPFPRKMKTRQARSSFAALHLAVQCHDSAQKSPVPVDVHSPDPASTAQVVQVDQAKFHLKGPMNLRTTFTRETCIARQD
jgi:hypothetical protein